MNFFKHLFEWGPNDWINPNYYPSRHVRITERGLRAFEEIEKGKTIVGTDASGRKYNISRERGLEQIKK